MNVYAYCKDHTHIIDPESYPNDIIAKQDKLGYKSGNCQEMEIQDIIVHAASNSPRAKEIIAEHTAASETYQNYEEARKVFPDLKIRCFIPKQAQMEDLVRRISEELPK
jgi:hypothetical protein